MIRMIQKYFYSFNLLGECCVLFLIGLFGCGLWGLLVYKLEDRQLVWDKECRWSVNALITCQGDDPSIDHGTYKGSDILRTYIDRVATGVKFPLR